MPKVWVLSLHTFSLSLDGGTSIFYELRKDVNMQGHDEHIGDQQTMSCTVSQHKKRYSLKKSCPLASVPNIKQAAANAFSTSILIFNRKINQICQIA